MQASRWRSHAQVIRVLVYFIYFFFFYVLKEWTLVTTQHFRLPASLDNSQKEGHFPAMSWRRPSMKFPFPVLLYAFVCIVVLLVYINFSTLPGRFNGNVKRNDETTSSDAQSDGKETRSNPSVLTDYMHYTKLLPVLDFRHLGNKRTKVLLLIIISTAPARFQRRQAVKETWWKHCRKNRQVWKQNFDTVVVKSIGSIFPSHRLTLRVSMCNVLSLRDKDCCAPHQIRRIGDSKCCIFERKDVTELETRSSSTSFR